MDAWVGRSLRLTTVCLTASGLLILPAVAGIGPSLPLAAVLVAVSAGCVAVRERLAALPTVVGYQLGAYAQDLWLAGGLAALVAIVGPAATPEELGALGGVLGLVGMVNYFLRPVYLAVLSLVLRRSTRG
jgi:hypothetical protein